MKRSTGKRYIKTTSLLLSIVIFVLATLNVWASEVTEKTYIKDVKLVYGETFDEAKRFVPEGYTLLDKNLNEGTDGDDKVYFAYSITSNPNEAVTDIKMMNMNGGFVLSDYEDQMADVNDKVKKLANDVKISADLFSANYVKGTYGAMAAYRALSAFTVDDAGGKSLADYIIYDKPTDDFYVKFVLNAHKDILSAVISALAMAVQGEPGDTWLDRLAALDDPEVDEEPTYWDDAVTLWEHFYGFYKVYITIDHSLYNNELSNKSDNSSGNEDVPPTADPIDPENVPEVEYNGTEALYEVAYKTLESYKFTTGEKLSDWLLGDDVFVLDEELIENFFCLLAVMTPEELSMMRLCGPLYMILATGMSEEAYNDYLERIEEITGGETVCSIWTGVNYELFSSSIGITDEAARKIAETEFERELNNEGDSTGEAGLKTAGLIGACGLVSLGVGLILYKGFAAFYLTCFSGTGLTATASVVSGVGAIFGAVATTLGIAALVVAVVVAIVYLIVWINELVNESNPEYTEIPEFMYDYVEDGEGNFQFVLYKGVEFQDGRVADVNTWEGKEWHAMYVSHDSAAGAPIEADVVIRYGNGAIDQGYAGLSNFGHINAQNLNGFAFEDEVDGIFITYRQESLKGDTFARKAYLSDVKLYSGELEDVDKIKTEMKNKGYAIHEENLSPGSDYVTYLGYKTTNNVSSALTDIRLAYGYNSTQYTTGGNKASYGMSGSTPDGMLTLYVTSISLFGSPITSDFLVLKDRNAPAGYEPVNLFIGGPAINLNMKEDTYFNTEKAFYLYFLPSETYTGGKEYLGGITFIYDQAQKVYDQADASGNGIGSVEEASKQLGYTVLYTTHAKYYEKNNLEGALAYTTTYNPYRAIYGFSASKESEAAGHLFSKTMYYDGVGYSLVDRFVVNADGDIGFEYYTHSKADGRLYAAGIYSGGKPVLVSDLYVSADQTDVPDGFYPVSARLSDDKRPVNLASGFYRQFNNSHAGGQSTTFQFDPFYLFVKGEGYKEGNYLTGIFITSKEALLGTGAETEDIDCDDVDNAFLMDQLAAMGAHTAILKNLNLADGDNVTYLGYIKAHKKSNSTAMVEPITNIILYYASDTDVTPKNEMIFDKISYTLAGGINLFCEEDGTNEVCDRVYLYYTTNPAAGSSIIDIKIDDNAILNGWETARTQNKKALYDDMDDYEDSMWFLHMKRTTEDPKYISEVVIGVGGSDADAKAVLIAAGCDYMLEKDLNKNVGAHSDYIYLGYKRTSNPSNAIRDIRTTHDNEVDSFVNNGATYYKIDGNLNSYTNVFADDIFLYYTKDAVAGTPITSLGTSQHEANWTHGDGGRYVVTTVRNQHNKASDLNAGAGGDYIYLLITRDKTDQGLLASMIGNGSIAVIVAFVVISSGVAAWIVVVQRKKNMKVGAEVGAASEHNEQSKDEKNN